MRTTPCSTNLQRTLGLLIAGAVLGSPVYADDQRARDSSAMNCEQYAGAKRADCEQRRDQERSAMSTRENDKNDKDDDVDRNTNDASSDTGTRSSDRTRVSRADANSKANNEDDESKYWDSEREREPGVVKGADMQTVPIPEPEDRRDDPNSDLSDPYQVAPGTDDGLGEDRE